MSRQSDLPRDLGSAAFVAGPNSQGHMVKRKLRILAETSYLLRTPCRSYLAKYADTKSEIDAIDSFLCQACTPWSGMGAVDLLAEVLDLPEARREDIRAWSQRHLAPYRVDVVKADRLAVVNLITDTPYETEFDNAAADFHPGMGLFGALVPWDGHWRWSGVQRLLDEKHMGKAEMDKIRDNMKRKMSKVLCRYWPEYREQVFKQSAELHEAQMAYYQGRNLIYFEDEKSMTKDNELFFKKRRDELLETQAPGKSGKGDGHGGEERSPALRMELPKHLRGSENGIGKFLDPVEGAEMVFGYNFLESALEKTGASLTNDERNVLREFIQGDVISPGFVKRVLQDFSPRSIQAELGVPADPPAYWLEWLLRCWKGEYYRVRYPELSVV